VSGSLFGTDLPIVAAPMAGGPTTLALVDAVAGAGGFPFLAAGYKSASDVAADIDSARAIGRPFGVNLFVPSRSAVDSSAFRAYAESIEGEAAAVGVSLDPMPRADDDDWDAKIALLVEQPAPVVSFTFGLPSAVELAALQRAGSMVVGSVTTTEEARQAAELGVDALLVQGPDGGGHSATFDPSRRIEPVVLPDLVRQVRSVVDLPVVAAGGVDGPAAVQSLLAAGAVGVAVGTLLLRTDEAGTSPTHRAALVDPRFDRTVITHAFTGRPARGLLNGFIERHEDAAPLGYPELHHLTRPMRQAAAKSGDPDRLHLWAGTGYRSAPTGSAADVVRMLGS
jgi:NAD(P)H-dependent flavin oxidoreductase YrpB (nitropropane dioxygenase family)